MTISRSITDSSNQANEILAELKANWGLPNTVVNQGRCRCPGHNGKNKNLAVTVDGDKVLMHCHSNQCSYEQILRGMGLWKDHPKTPPKQHKAPRLVKCFACNALIPIAESVQTESGIWACESCARGMAESTGENLAEVTKTGAEVYGDPNFAPPAPNAEAEATPVDLEYQPASLPGPEWIPEYAPIPGITINRAVAIWHGAGGSSKSLFVLSASCALITGRGAICGMELTGRPKPGGGFDAIRHRVLYLSLEDPRSVIEGRIGALCSLYKIDPPQLAELLIVDREQAKPLVQSGRVLDRIASIRKLATEIKPTICFIDHMRLFDPDAELSPDSAMHTIKGLENLAADLNLSIVVLHHDRKMPPQNGQATRGDDMASGTTGLHTNSRAFAQFRATEDRGLVIAGGKANYSARFGQQEYMIDTETINGHAQPVLVAIQAPDIFDGIPAKTCKEIVKAITEAKPELARENNRLEGWAGGIAAELAGLDIGDTRKGNRIEAQTEARRRIQEWLSAWVRAGYLKTETVEITMKDRHKQDVKIYRKGAQKYE